ncbi:MAG: WD40 repeat protein/tRNA A-37 threonylcarbamoyl transferase component Bud32 [Chlamydiales bacterium]|jgi:WD40 repeat protein/tRNA A-37 threonylcarbamoyl transferase component Bud32
MPDSTQFGRYEIEEEVARGGMGVVYRVRDPEMRRFLAMKVLLSDEGRGKGASSSRHSKLSARFTEEAQLTGQLDHPGIIPVYDMGRDSDGQLFFTMRLVKGRTLEEIFDLVSSGKEGWTITRALGVLQKVCEAMAFAHEHGVIHRDLKPANVMVGKFGETYVMDWGLAKLIDGTDSVQAVPEAPLQTILTSARSEESSVGGALDTLEGDVMGTPSYMAPEQARGQVHRVEPRSDVYSLGSMLYHLLAGHPPYSPVGEKLSGRDILERLLEGPPPDVESLADSVPAELCAICARAMAREPEARYGDMLDVAEDLQAYVENRVVQAYRRGAVLEFKKWVQRNSGIAVSLAAMIVLVIAGLGAVSFVQARARAAVEGKNSELEATNAALETERKRTAEARDLAEQNKARALASEEVALANEEEALWQSYVGNIGAAHAALEVGSASEARRRLAACPEALRNWEWRYLSQRADGSLRVLMGSETFVTTLSVDPTGNRVAAAGGRIGSTGAPDQTIRIWDYESGQVEQALLGHDQPVSCIAFSPAGDSLASCDTRGNLRVWDVESGATVAEVPVIGTQLDYHPNGRWIVTATPDSGPVRLWDSYDRIVVAENEVPVGTNAVRVSPDGERIALAGKDYHIRILDQDLEVVLDLDASGEALAEDYTQIGAYSGPGVYALDFSPDGRHLVSGSGDGFVRIWDVATGERLRFLRGHRSIVHAVRWHPRFPWIVSSDSSGSIRFWDADTGQPLDVLRGHDEDVYALGFSALGDRLLSASRDNTVRVWDGQAGANDTVLDGLEIANFRPYDLAFSPDGERIVWRSGAEVLSVTNVRTGEDICSIYSGTDEIQALQFWGDEIHLCVSGQESIWSATTGERLSAVTTAWGESAAYWAGDRELVLTGVHYREPGKPSSPWLKLVELPSGETRWTRELEFHAAEIFVSPAGDQFLTGAIFESYDDCGFTLFDASSGERLWQLRGIPNVHGVAFLPDRTRFAHTNYNLWDNLLSIRSTETGELLETFKGHAQPSLLAISPDGSRIVTGNWDGTVSLWSPERGEILILPGHTGFVARVGFSPDGQTIASLGGDGHRRLWSAGPVESRQTQRRAAARRRRWTVDARRRVDELLGSRVTRAAVVEALEADSSLRPEQRDAAILMARLAPTSPEALMARAGPIVMDPARTGAEYMAAMNGARLAVDLAGDLTHPDVGREARAEFGPKLASLHMIDGMAQLQLGLPRDALACLTRAEQIHASGVAWTSPPLAFLKAMAHHHLGNEEQAVHEYDRGRAALRLKNRAWQPYVLQMSIELQARVRALLGR